MSTERIDIQITETGARRVKGGIESIGTAATGTERALTLLRRTLGALGITALVRNLLQTADAYTTILNRVRLVTQGHAQLALATDRVLEIANRTRNSFEATAEAYVKTARVANDLGLSQNRVLQFTESLNQAIAISGSTATQAEMGIRQLGQALGRGVLIGDEFVSIMENTNEVAQVIAKGLGVPIGQLKQLSTQGKITAQVIVDAFQNARVELAEKFATTIPTFNQALTVLNNRWISLIGRMNESSGVTRALAQVILFLSQNLETLARVLGIVGMVLLVHLARVAIPAAIRALQAMMGWIVANPWLALVTAITAAAAALVMFSDKITVSQDKLVTLADVGVATFNILARGTRWLGNQFSTAWQFILATGRELFGNLIDVSLSFPRSMAKSLDTIILGFKVMGNVIVAIWDNIKKLFSGSPSSVTETIRNAMLETVRNNQRGPVEGLLDSIMEEARMVSNSRIERAALEENARLRAEREMDKHGLPAPVANAPGKFKKSFGSELQELRMEGLLLLKNAQAREIQNNVITIESQLKRNLNQQELEQVAAVSLTNIALRNRAEALETLGGPTEQYRTQMEALNAIMRDTPELTDQVREEMAKLEIQMLQGTANTGSGLGAIADGYVRQLRIMQLETRNAVGDLGAEWAKLFGPGGMVVQGIGDAVAQSVVFGERFDQAIKKIAQSVVVNLISSLIQLGINMVLNAALGNSLAVAAAASSVATASAVTAAWGPAATLVNAATFGAGAAAGTGALATSLATVKGLATVGSFAEGGYTGAVGRSSVAGVVHGQEYVLNANATRRVGRSNLDRINAGAGFGSQMNVTVVNRDIPGVEFQVNQLSSMDVEIIAQKVVRRDAPGVIATDLNNPTGRVSRSLSSNTDSRRRRNG